MIHIFLILFRKLIFRSFLIQKFILDRSDCFFFLGNKCCIQSLFVFLCICVLKFRNIYNIIHKKIYICVIYGKPHLICTGLLVENRTAFWIFKLIKKDGCKIFFKNLITSLGKFFIDGKIHIMTCDRSNTVTYFKNMSCFVNVNGIFSFCSLKFTFKRLFNTWFSDNIIQIIFLFFIIVRTAFGK